MLKRTPLYHEHVEAGAKFTEFGGWDMPVSYSGILEEAMAVRTTAGLFDLSHMGEFLVEGKGAAQFLNKIITRDVSVLSEGQILYALMCEDDGGIIDDILIYALPGPSYLLVVNASNTDKDLEWLHSHLPGSKDVQVHNKTQDLALLAIQGPKSAEILTRISGDDFASLKYYTFRTGKVSGVDALVSRTGYTGEDGFEIYFSPSEGPHLWSRFLEGGDAIPVGLGARDVLRLEMKYLLYGNDISEETSPIDAGLSWAIQWDKEDFIGKRALMDMKEAGPSKRLVGFVMDERGVPRHGAALYYEGQEQGQVTSGTRSPYLKKEIGLGYLPLEAASPGTEIGVDMRGRIRQAHVVKTPFISPRVKR